MVIPHMQSSTDRICGPFHFDLAQGAMCQNLNPCGRIAAQEQDVNTLSGKAEFLVDFATFGPT